MMVPYGYDSPDPRTGGVTPVMECAAAADVERLSAELLDYGLAVRAFLDAHPGRSHRGCLFCQRCPHVIDFLTLVVLFADDAQQFLDRCRPPTAGEFRGMQEDYRRDDEQEGSPVVAQG